MKNIRTAMNRGAFDFVTKPIDFQDLRITIDRTLHHMALWRDALASRDKLVALQNELHVASEMQQSICRPNSRICPAVRCLATWRPRAQWAATFSTL